MKIPGSLSAALMLFAGSLAAQTAAPISLWSGTGCTSSGCHVGVEPIRELDTGMMKQILTLGKAVADIDGCTVCHGGDATPPPAGPRIAEPPRVSPRPAGQTSSTAIPPHHG